MIFKQMYKEFLSSDKSAIKMLDVGGGYTSLTSLFLKNCDYYLLDIMAHDDHSEFENQVAKTGKDYWINSDWYSYRPVSDYDLVIANDIFPNVDQRLELFIEKYLPYCKEIRISLTFYNTPRFYSVKRTDAEEIFFMLAWTGQQTLSVIEKYKNRINNFNPDLFLTSQDSLFPNKRQIIMLSIKGNVG
jgi:hypothetical protein